MLKALFVACSALVLGAGCVGNATDSEQDPADETTAGEEADVTRAATDSPLYNSRALATDSPLYNVAAQATDSPLYNVEAQATDSPLYNVAAEATDSPLY